MIKFSVPTLYQNFSRNLPDLNLPHDKLLFVTALRLSFTQESIAKHCTPSNSPSPFNEAQHFRPHFVEASNSLSKHLADVIGVPFRRTPLEKQSIGCVIQQLTCHGLHQHVNTASLSTAARSKRHHSVPDALRLEKLNDLEHPRRMVDQASFFHSLLYSCFQVGIAPFIKVYSCMSPKW